MSKSRRLRAPGATCLRFRRHSGEDATTLSDRGPKVLMVAPMSGHFATLLRGTVEAFLPDHDVYITDWRDARDVPLLAPDFTLDDYIDYVMDSSACSGRRRM